MIAIAVLPPSQRRSASLPAARRSRRALPSQRPQTLSKRRAPATPSYVRDRTSLVAFAPTDNTGTARPPPPRVRSVRDLQIPIGPAQANRAPSSPRFPPYEAFERRPLVDTRAPAMGPASETLQQSGHSRSPMDVEEFCRPTVAA